MSPKFKHTLSHVEEKLVKYKKTNKEISRKVSAKRVEITKLKNLLTTSTSDIINARTECRKWKSKILNIKNMHMDQTLSPDFEFEALKKSYNITNMLDECIVEMERFLAIPTPASYIPKRSKKRPKKAKRKSI